MEVKWDFRNKFTMLAVAVATVLFLASMYVMVTYAADKVVIVTEDETQDVSEKEEEIKQSFSYALDLSNMKDISLPHDLTIHCKDETGEDNLTLVHNYSENKAIIILRGVDSASFLNNHPKGKLSYLNDMKIAGNGSEIMFTLEFSRLCECVASFEGNSLNLDFKPVKGTDTVILIDAGHGGSKNGIKVGDLCEKDITLNIAKALQKLSEGKPYRVIPVRSGDYTLSEGKRLEYSMKLNADYYIGLHADADAGDERKYGMYAEYNGAFYREGFSNAGFADNILRNTCEATLNRGIALYDRFDDEMLREFEIPAMNLYVGFMSNKDEAELLNSPAYIEKIAEGILNGIEETLRKRGE